ncbi:MAG: hypothetical protein ABIQ10_04995 [Gemmatimonadaceae bacterium]
MSKSSNAIRSQEPAKAGTLSPPRRPPSQSSRPKEKPQREPRAGFGTPLVVLLSVLALINVAGYRYYLLSAGERVRSPLHAWLKPSGLIGQPAGILALLIFLFLWLYPLRKKFKSLAWTGSLGRWMDIHILAALGLPLLLAIHAAWRFDGVIGLGFLSMMIVVASGIVGRYLYVRIPRSKSGVELTRDEVSARRRALVQQIAETMQVDVETIERTLRIDGATAESSGIMRTLGQLLTNDIRRWRTARELRRKWKNSVRSERAGDRAALAQAVKLASREISLEQQARMLNATHKVFRYWHVAHRPFALTALVAVVVHVAVVIYVGATWFR